jgi:hypothetical protein
VRRAPGPRFNEHLDDEGPTVFLHACKLASKASCRSERTLATAWLTGLDQEQEPELAGGEVRGGGGVGTVTLSE